MNEMIITAVVSAFCTGGLSWLVTFKYTKKQAEADAMKSVQEVYQNLINDLKEERTEDKKEIAELKGDVFGLKQKVDANEQEIRLMKPNLCGRKACTQRIPIN